MYCNLQESVKGIVRTSLYVSMQDVLFRPLFVLNFSRKARTWEGISFLQNLLRCLLRLATSRPVNVNLELEGNNPINNNNNSNNIKYLYCAFSIGDAQ